MRAGIMFALSLTARLLGRTYDTATALSVAAALLLVENPAWIDDTGFQLSFTAAFAASAAVPAFSDMDNLKDWFLDVYKRQIIQRGQAVGLKKALIRMAGLVADEIKNPQGKYLMISHCNNPEKAEWVRDMIMEKVSFTGSYILNTAGISSMYANDGGIIIAG